MQEILLFSAGFLNLFRFFPVKGSKGGNRMFEHQLRKREKVLKDYISKSEKWLGTAPEGRLWVSTTTSTRSHFKFLTTSRKYLSPSRDLKKIKDLAKKEYLEHVNSESKKELTALKDFLRTRNLVKDAYMMLHEAKRELVTPVEIPADVLVHNFMSEVYPPPDYEMANPKETLRGESVRSFAEALIADELFKAGIPYRYERPFTLYNKHVVHPDFTIMDPSSGRIIIWEHFGMTQRSGYKDNMVSKIKDYAKSGMVIGDGLIVTFENDELKITREEIRQIIDVFLN